MSVVDVLTQPAAVVEVIMAGGASIDVHCVPPAIVEVAVEGTQGPRGLNGAEWSQNDW